MERLIEKLKRVKDFRREQGKRHPLWIVLLIVIIGIMKGCTGYREIGDFAKFQKSEIVATLKILDGKVPSYSTIRRVIEGVDRQNFISVFNEWGQELEREDVEEDWMCVDGKALRSTLSEPCDSSQNFLNMVSLFSASRLLVLRMGCFENKKSSEIHQARELIEDCGFEDKVFTFDSLHCQTETIQEILNSDNDYVIAVKGNQPTLYQTLESVARSRFPDTINVTADVQHGRHIWREVAVFPWPEGIDPRWGNIQSLIEVVRWGTREKVDYYYRSYYISNLPATAKEFSKGIREHWFIENRLHWVKDVIFREDYLPFSGFQAVTNFSILQSIALNLFRLLGFLSITGGQRWLGHRWSRLWVLLE